MAEVELDLIKSGFSARILSSLSCLRLNQASSLAAERGKELVMKTRCQLVEMRTGVLKSQFSELNRKTVRCNHTSVYLSSER